MGRRKERRLAALSAAGRRVKLDLFPEPSGDLGGSSANEVEGDLDQNNAGVPISPSSSELGLQTLWWLNLCPLAASMHLGGFGRKLFFVLGQCQDNPLLLLGQYSDDEITEEANRRLQDAGAGPSLINRSGKDEEPTERGHGSVEDKTGESFVNQQVKQEEWKKESAQSNAVMNLDDNGVKENGVAPSDDPCEKVDLVTQISDSLTSEMQITGDSSSGWKTVMHEESNQYYYWNTETGETSWEVPKVLSQVVEMASEKDFSLVGEERESILANTSASCNLNEEMTLYSSATVIAESFNAHVISEAKENYEVGAQEGNTSQGYEGSQNPIISYFDDVRDQQLSTNEEHDDRAAASPTHLVVYGQKLLQKLKELERFDELLEGNAWISKYIFEIEIRLSDCKSLLAYGTSLLPFWIHSEEKLRALENSIAAEISHFYKSEQLKEVDTGHISSHEGDGNSLQSLGVEPGVHEKVQVVTPTLVKRDSTPNIDSLEVAQKEDNVMPTSIDADIRHTSPSISTLQHSGAVAEENLEEVEKTANAANLVLRSETFRVDDMDMDVDMEVDDETSADHRTPEDAPGITNSKQSIRPNPQTVECPEGEYAVPPPPDEEWIPPPPPDNEPVPPPPPDEPLVSAYPSQLPFSETVQPFPYTEQYNMTYSVSGFEYYRPMDGEVASTSYYGHTEGQQTAVPQPPQYYDGTVSNTYSEATSVIEPHPPQYYGTVSNTYSEATSVTDPQPTQYYGTVSNTYSEATSVIVNPVDPLVFYDFPNGTGPTRLVISNVESSGSYSESVSVSYVDAGATDQVGSLGGLAESGDSSSTSLKAKSDASAVSSETEMKAVQIPSLSTTNQVKATTDGENAPASLITASSAATAPAPAQPAAATKTQSKVLRSKKRALAVAPTLRSNKKVSSLVDKWKAAKEELHEDEKDEPENAYEMLERKRQKEIEEWHAQQIASGEAKDNANFQPLGVDWRERVKRKRAQSANSVVQTQSNVSTTEKQLPDLIEISRDLPSGWQAYWDEASKEVYYGNVITSETTWSRPTR